MKKLLTLLMAIVISGFAWGQTVLISPTGDGGFETGLTPATNNWTAVNSTTDGWYVGAIPVVSAGVNCGYISSTAGTDWTYTQFTVVQHMYYDVTIPAGESKVTLAFKWKALGEGSTTSDWDNMKVFFGLSSAIGTPVANTAISSSYQVSGAGAISGMYKLNSAAWNSETINLIGTPGATYRLVFSWKSDISGIVNPPAAIDEVALTSIAPDALHGIYSIDNTMPTTTPMVHTGLGNFNSFTAAINHLNSEGISAAVTFNVASAQIFTEDCPAILATGTVSNPITFHKFGAGVNPVIQPTGTAGTTDAGITLTGGDYITFDGIDIAIATGSAVEYGYLIRNATVTNGAKYNTIKNSKITLNRSNTSSRGIYQYRFATASDTNGTNSHNVYQNNTIENSYQGIYLVGTATYPDLGCWVYSNIVGAATANDIGGGSVACNGIRASYQSDITIADNIVRNVFTSTAAIYGIYLEGAVGTNNVFNNKVYSLVTTGTGTNVIYGIRTDINATFTTNVFNNMISDLNHGAISATATQVIRAMAVGVSGTGTGNFIFNSVLISEDAFPSSTAMYVNNGTAYVFNNIFANQSTAGATSKRYCIYRNGGTLYSDFNDLYIDNVGTNNFTGYYTADRITLANWQAASGNQDMNFISEDPTFVGPTDLHTNNPAFNGTATAGSGITFDIDMEPRDPDFPDMGADENLSTVVFTCTTPAPGNTIASDNAICFGQPVTFSLQNATSGTGVSYQWQSSPDGVTYTNIGDETSAIYTDMPVTSTYYRCIVTCQNGPTSVESNPVQLTFANSILSTTPASRCGTGTVSLAATATPGATISWYDAATDTLMGTGSPWTTPIISTTTTYNVAAEIPALGVVLGAGALTSSGYQSPFYHLYGGMKSQFLILASELTAAGFTTGNINTLGIQVVAPGGVFNDFNLSMGSTLDGALTTTFVTGLNNVYSNSALSFIAGYNSIVLASPYNWDGTSNIVIEFCWSNNNGGGTGATVKYDATSFVAESYARADNQTAAVLCATATAYGTYSNRPQFYLNYAPICAGERFPVIATVSTAPALTLTADQTVCNNTVATIAVTSTLGNYDSYIWTPETNLFTDLACTMPYVSAASATTVYVKTVTAASITYTCVANNSTTQCSEIETSTVTILPAAPLATASPEEVCLSGASTIMVDPATGYGDATFQWQHSTDNVIFNDIAAANSINFTTPTITSTTYYKLLVKLGASVCTESNVVTITVNNPQVVSSTPAARCGTGTVILGATGSAGTTLNWYAASTGGLSLGTGTSYTTPVISTTTDYYVSAGMGETTTYGGRLAPTATTIASSSNWGLVFDAYNDFTLETVEVYATAAGNVLVQLQSNTGAVLQSATVPVIAGSATVPQVLTLNFNVTAGTSLRLIAVSSPNMVRESSIGGFPYPLGTNGTITSGYISGTSTSYYYFYNWGIKTGCASARTMVTATVTTPPSVSVTATPGTICVGETSTLDASSTNVGYTYSWTPATTPANGASVSASPVLTTVYSVTATDNSGGANDGCASVASVTLNVNPIPTAVTVTPASATFCEGVVQELNANGGTIGTLGTFGTGTTTNTTTSYPSPYTTYYGGTKHQMLILASELTAAGMVAGEITSISFTVAAVGATFSGILDSFQVRMVNTTTSVMTSSAFESGLTLVYGPLDQTIPTTGLPALVTHAITPFIWDGTSNIVIETSFSNGIGGSISDNVQMTNSTTSFVSTNWFRSDSKTAAYILAATTPTGSGTARPNMVLDNVVISPITWSPPTGLYTDVAATIPYTGATATTVYAKPLSGVVTYTATATGTNLCTNSGTTVLTVDPCTGIEDNYDGISVSVVPNPSNGLFYISVEGLNEAVSLNIYSVAGQVVYSDQIDNNGLVNIPIDLKSYPKGMYFLRLTNNNMTHTEKIIVE